ncbi:hypothetical protein [Paenibacillus tyrfis]|uniref:Uncharacterized protein n=1 Tax=Paenibacillus tyrfis TaxID=1501230 RepID=A0A081P0F4_9BACL|nr:hypothetical protein [Paenibacillus tyrfis]KEQ24177.1 hypothetical protein ET33_10800 [Paenibacillus tyrfis]
MKKRFAALLLTLSFAFSLAVVPASAKSEETQKPVVVQTIKSTPETEKELIEKFNLKKPSPDAKLNSIRIIEDKSYNYREDRQITPNFQINGYVFEETGRGTLHGSTPIVETRYFCSKPSGCKSQAELQANSSVAHQFSATFGGEYNSVISAAVGYNVTDSTGVAATLVLQEDNIPYNKTWICQGYAVHNYITFNLYKEFLGIKSKLGSGTTTKPIPNRIVATDWFQ